MNTLIDQIKAAAPYPVSVKVTDMTWCDKGIQITVYSNGDAANTVETRHAGSDSVETIIAAHDAARAPKSQAKSRAVAKRVYRQVFGS